MRVPSTAIVLIEHLLCANKESERLIKQPVLGDRWEVEDPEFKLRLNFTPISMF